MKHLLGLSCLLFSLAGCSQNDGSSNSSDVAAKPAAPAAAVSAASQVEAPKTAAAPAAPAPSPAPAAAVIQPTLGTVSAAEPPPTPPNATVPDAVISGPAPQTNAAPKSAWERLGKMVGNLTNLAGTTTPAATNSVAGPASTVSVADLPTDQITRGLKEALAKGLDHAIAQLGKDGGFLTNANVRIPIPEKLQGIEKILRRTGQDKLADDFVASMNRAAEKAVPVAAGVFSDGLKQMTVEDARAILQGPKDAATQYFRKTTGPQLEAKFRPIVSEATSQAGVTAAYKNLLDKVGFAGTFLKQESVDLDGYVTGKATDGLFKMVAEEEKKIRENPVARTTDLLKSVFGVFGR